MTWTRRRNAKGRFARRGKKTETARSPRMTTIKRNYKLKPKKATKRKRRKK